MNLIDVFADEIRAAYSDKIFSQIEISYETYCDLRLDCTPDRAHLVGMKEGKIHSICGVPLKVTKNVI